MFMRRGWRMRNWGYGRPMRYGYGHRWHRRFGCFPGCGLLMILPILMTAFLVLALFGRYL
jgi:hypothetical protein